MGNSPFVLRLSRGRTMGHYEVEYWEIGTNKVAVPTHYFKIVIDVKSGGSVKSIAFLIPHKKMTKPYTRYLVSIDRIEGVTRV